MAQEFQVGLRDFTQHRVVTRAERGLEEGEVRLKVDLFAFTANNMTYAAAGDFLGYWQFYPATTNDGGNWGIIPVWGLADVIESRCDHIPVGDRVYGYFAPATDTILKPTHISSTAFHDATEHRQSLPPLYNRYSRVLSEPGYDPSMDVARVLLMPLYFTSYCLCDKLAQNDWYGADQVVIISASSKTSLGVAYGLAGDEAAPSVVGLTSAGNVPFVEGLGYYDSTIAYADLEAKLARKPTVVIDMAGNGEVRRKLSDHLGESLRYYIGVGMTHWDSTDVTDWDGDAASGCENFFVPSYALERIAELGPSEFDKRSLDFMIPACAETFKWMRIDERDGVEELSAIYPEFCAGTVPPTTGVIVKM